MDLVVTDFIQLANRADDFMVFEGFEACMGSCARKVLEQLWRLEDAVLKGMEVRAELLTSGVHYDTPLPDSVTPAQAWEWGRLTRGTSSAPSHHYVASPAHYQYPQYCY